MGLFDFLKQIQNAGVAMLARGALNFTTGFTLTDDPANNRINVAASGGGGLSPGDQTFLNNLHVAPVQLTDASTTLLWSTSANYQLQSAALTADRTFTIGVSDTPPVGALLKFTAESQGAFRAFFANGGGSGGNIVSGSLAPGQNQNGTIVARYDGSNWKLDQDPGRTQIATTATAGLMTSGDKTFVNAINTGAGAVVSPSSLRATAATLPIQDSTGAATLTATLASAGASLLTWAAGVTSVVYGWTQHASAAGNATTYGGQQGASGFVGGDVSVISGAGGDASHKGGVIHIDTGAAVGGIGSSVSFENGGVVLATMAQSSTSVFKIRSGNNTLSLDSGGSGALNLFSNHFGWFDNGSNTVRTDTWSGVGACTIAWGSGVTSLAESLPSGVGKVSTFAFSENSGQRNSPFQSMGLTTGTFTPNWNSGENVQETTTSTGAITVANGTNPRDGAVYTVVVVTGAFAVTFGAAYKGPNAGAPTASVNSKTNEWSFKYNAALTQYIQQSNVSF